MYWSRRSWSLFRVRRSIAQLGLIAVYGTIGREHQSSGDRISCAHCFVREIDT